MPPQPGTTAERPDEASTGTRRTVELCDPDRCSGAVGTPLSPGQSREGLYNYPASRADWEVVSEHSCDPPLDLSGDVIHDDEPSGLQRHDPAAHEPVASVPAPLTGTR